MDQVKKLAEFGLFYNVCVSFTSSGINFDLVQDGSSENSSQNSSINKDMYGFFSCRNRINDSLYFEIMHISLIACRHMNYYCGFGDY